MKGAQPFEILPCLAQGDVVTHDVDNVHPALDTFDRVIGNQTLPHESLSSWSLN